jgi:hypothetical protein
MNTFRQIREKAMLVILFLIASLNANALKLYSIYRMTFNG